MSILDLSDAGLDETHEEIVIAAGEERKLRIVSAMEKISEKGVHFMMPFFEVIDDPYCKEFGDYMPIPDKNNMSAKELNRARIRIGSFIAAFGLSTNLDFDDLQGKEGWAILGVGKDQDDQPQNKINKYIMGA